MPPRTNELRILYAIAEKLNSATDLRSGLEGMLALVAGLLRLRSGWIWLVDPESNRFYIAAAYNLPPYLQEPVRMAGTWCQCTELFREGKLSAKNVDVIECSRLAPAVEQKLTALTARLRYHASVPLLFQGKQLGIMNLTGPKWRRLSPSELRLLTTIALQAGATVERTRLSESTARLARTEERSRIAREIHDTLVQQLTGIALQLEAALKHLKPSDGARKELVRALDIAREGIREARGSVASLRGSPTADKPLKQVLDALARGFTSRTGVPVSVQSASLELPTRIEAELLRIVQEALTNVSKHARATSVVVQLARRGRMMELCVRDNGVGFRSAKPHGGQGILGMRERAQLIGGSLSVKSALRRGTTVCVSFPFAGVK